MKAYEEKHLTERIDLLQRTKELLRYEKDLRGARRYEQLQREVEKIREYFRSEDARRRRVAAARREELEQDARDANGGQQ